VRAAWVVVVVSIASVACAGGGDNETANQPITSVTAVDDDGTATGETVRLETVDVEGTAVEYAVVTPPGFEPGDAVPVVLALPPGGQDRDTTERVTAQIYATEASARGFVVLSPVAPGALFFQGSEDLIPGFLDATAVSYPPLGDRYLLAGVSNGGLSAFRVIGAQPDRFAALFVFPGYPSSDEDRARLTDLAGIPVQMYVGGDDTGWVTPMQATLTALRDAGIEADLEVVEGEGHIISQLGDGKALFDFFDQHRPE
jgi:pimeloyl-ACP methyl ester carboxylesterase